LRQVDVLVSQGQNLVDAIRMTFSALCGQAANQVTHLNNVAQGLIPGYTGSLSADAADTANTIQAAITWITTNVPKDVNGIVMVYKWNTDGTQTSRTFSPVQTAGLAAALNAVGQTIGP
jgi:hypothetical protein